MKKKVFWTIATATPLAMIIVTFLAFAQTAIVRPEVNPPSVSIPSATAPQAHRPKPQIFAEQEAVNPQYVQLADDIGWPGGTIAATQKNKMARDAADRAKFDNWLFDNEFSVYDEEDVIKYMDKQIVDANDAARRQCPQNQAGQSCIPLYYSWDWFPLSGQKYETAANYVFNGSTFIVATSSTSAPTGVETTSLGDNKYRRDYVQPIPANILADAAAIKKAWPDAEFDVTAVDKHIDPFISVRFPWGREIFGKWDEPNFGK